MKDATLVTTLGRAPAPRRGVSIRRWRQTSTVLSPNVEAYEAERSHHGITYGRSGTTTTYAFEEAIGALENGLGRWPWHPAWPP